MYLIYLFRLASIDNLIIEYLFYLLMLCLHFQYCSVLCCIRDYFFIGLFDLILGFKCFGSFFIWFIIVFYLLL